MPRPRIQSADTPSAPLRKKRPRHCPCAVFVSPSVLSMEAGAVVPMPTLEVAGVKPELTILPPLAIKLCAEACKALKPNAATNSAHLRCGNFDCITLILKMKTNKVKIYQNIIFKSINNTIYKSYIIQSYALFLIYANL